MSPRPEQLNTRDVTHPMKGHPGYQGDDIDYCAEIVRQVDSHAKLLFDVIMWLSNGDGSAASASTLMARRSRGWSSRAVNWTKTRDHYPGDAYC
jgi:hypothetical protein